MALKAIIFGLWDTLIFEGKFADHKTLYKGVDKFLKFVSKNGIIPIVLTKRTARLTNGSVNDKDWKSSLKEFYTTDFNFIIPHEEGLPKKSTTAIVDHIKSKYGLASNEIVYIGNSEMDFRTAVNSKLLFINAKWHCENVKKYGISISDPIQLINFIKLFCSKSHLWQFISNNPIKFYSLAPFSTYKNRYKDYSFAAKLAAKQNNEKKEFFLNHAATSIYFSGLFEEFDFITVYPGHEKGYGNPVMNESLSILGSFFRKKYIPDLIIRHKTSIKLQHARIKGISFDKIADQLSTIHLNKTPMQSEKRRYKDFSTKIKGKRILVIDDFCTEGTSLEAARNLIIAAGGECIGMSWLKTINTNYKVYDLIKPKNPFVPNNYSQKDYVIRQRIRYTDLNCDMAASDELIKIYEDYLDLKSNG